jgi:glutaredoxin
MYTRRGCHLCEDAWALLERQRRRYGFALEAVDVDGDPELAGRYGHEVPVVKVGDRVRFRGTVNPHLLTRLLRVEAQRGG